MIGIDFIDDLISQVGLPLVKKGIKSVTGIDLDAKELTAEDKQKIMDSQIEIMKIDFEKLKLGYEDKQKQEQNITDRWSSDNNSDSRFAKLLRPVLTAYLIIIVTLLALCDGNIGNFTIKENWVELFTTLCITTVSGYFVLRTYEKRTGTSTWKTNK